jgi:hypothetical protein
MIAKTARTPMNAKNLMAVVPYRALVRTLLDGKALANQPKREPLFLYPDIRDARVVRGLCATLI